MGYPEVKAVLQQRIYKAGDYQASKEDLRAILDAAPEKDGKTVALETLLSITKLNMDIAEFAKLTSTFRGQGIDDAVPPGLNGAVKFDSCKELDELVTFLQKADYTGAKFMYQDIFEELGKLRR